jgi:Fatty acid desaturase
MQISERELDQRFLECGLERAHIWHNTNHARREEWNCYNVITKDMIFEAENLRRQCNPQMLLLDSLIAADEPLRVALVTFLITELGITEYPKTVEKLFNPLGVKNDDNDPFNYFGRIWTSEEFQHGLAELRALEILGIDMVEVERVRKLFIVSGDTPKFYNSFDGLAYTTPQEANTAIPYQQIIRRFKTFYKLGIEKDSDAGRILMAVIDTYRYTAQDERLHELFMKNTVDAGLRSGDRVVAGAMVCALSRGFIDTRFSMPGSSMDDYRRRILKIARAGIFTAKHVQRAKIELVKGWDLATVCDMDEAGESGRLKLINFALAA